MCWHFTQYLAESKGSTPGNYYCEKEEKGDYLLPSLPQSLAFQLNPTLTNPSPHSTTLVPCPQ